MPSAECLCGAVAYEVDAPFSRLSHCHCSRCRKAHGSAFASYAEAPLRHFRFTRGEANVERYTGTGSFPRTFCRHCGSVVPGDVYEDNMFVPAGPLDGGVGAIPMSHIFVGSKAPWDELHDALPRFDAFPSELGIAGMPDRTPVDPSGPLRGSCLCDAVGFVVEGPLLFARHCHCSRCRRARAAAHASNLFVAEGGVRYTRGAERVGHYKVPAAERFTQYFCRICGAKLPRPPGASQLPVAIPMGALDDDPGLRPECHIFVASKAPWYEIVGPLAQHAEYPPPA